MPRGKVALAPRTVPSILAPMMRFAAMTLALVCNASLALPPGWCCMVAPTPLAAAAPYCCNCCCECQSEPAPQQNEKPKPFDLFKCCCADRNAANPHDQHFGLLTPAPSVLALFAGDSTTEYHAEATRCPVL